MLECCLSWCRGKGVIARAAIHKDCFLSVRLLVIKFYQKAVCICIYGYREEAKHLAHQLRNPCHMVDYTAGARIVRLSAGKETEWRVVLSFLFGKFLLMIVIACSGVVWVPSQRMRLPTLRSYDRNFSSESVDFCTKETKKRSRLSSLLHP